MLSKTIAVFSVICLLFFIGGIFSTALKQPTYNTDLLFYTAIYYENTGNDLATAHDRVYNYQLTKLPDSIQAFMTTKKMELLCRDDAQYFSAMLPFYKLKWFYNQFIFVLAPVLNSPVLAILFISVFSFSLLLILLFVFLNKFLSPWLAVVLCICIGSFTPVFEISKEFTPDALSSLFVFAGLLFLFFNKKYWLTMLFFLLAVLTRPDNIIYPIVFGFYFLWKEKANRNSIVFFSVSIAVQMTAYFLLMHFANSYGWKITLQHSLVDPAVIPTEWNSVSLEIADYFLILLKNILLNKKDLLFFLFLFLLVIYSSKGSSIKFKQLGIREIYLLVLAVFVIRFLIFPNFETRYFAVLYIVNLSFLAITIISGKQYSSAEIRSEEKSPT